MLKSRMELGWGYQVTVANSGKEGLEKARTVDFDLVLTDYMMPNMNGEEVLDVLKKSKPNPPVFMFSVYYDDDSPANNSIYNNGTRDPVDSIIMNNYVRRDTIVDRIRSKADAIISKPIDFDLLHKTIQDVLSK